MNPKVASKGDEMHWSGDVEDRDLRPEMRIKMMAMALCDEVAAAARVSKAARLGVSLPRVLGALNSLESEESEKETTAARGELGRDEFALKTMMTWLSGVHWSTIAARTQLRHQRLYGD